jgi:hypothetical protein
MGWTLLMRPCKLELPMRTALLCSMLVAFGCEERNPNYCPENPPDNLCPMNDAAERCSATKPCSMGVWLGAALMTPVFVGLGRLSGEKIAELEGRVEGLTQILGFVALALIVGVVIHLIVSHKPRRGLGGWRTHGDGRTGVPPGPASTEGPAESSPEVPPAPGPRLDSGRDPV